ncbi:MAG: radical SAM family heme chaperone HemW [Candidatus Symbiothrix sp.]|jgi:oxygen-independent coproporphyrinogen-3 oxidase|nr:radical SAM family heme chaperone HemW [Candidatus Symbiothrix sp.]
MASIYFHIPFCKKRCIYCDFFSSVDCHAKVAYVDALCREVELRKDYLKGEAIETIYFGGGTPSQLSAGDFRKIFQNLSFGGEVEITLESNPDDLIPEYLDSLKNLPFNRISLGIQSFHDDELRFLNRRHTAEPAIQAVKRCQETGFQNISIDLMYGLPNQTLAKWRITLQQAIDLKIQHISAYHLMYESGTPLFDLWQRGKIHPIDEELGVAMFEQLIDRLSKAGFEQYEISNFARSGCHSRHNSAYWNGTPYLGIGASAHSYNRISRQWNSCIAGAGYLSAGFEMELLDEKAMFNDFIITRLRTMKGIDLNEMQSLFGKKKTDDCLRQAEKHLQNQLLQIEETHLRLSRKGIFVSDGIMSDLIL